MVFDFVKKSEMFKRSRYFQKKKDLYKGNLIVVKTSQRTKPEARYPLKISFKDHYFLNYNSNSLWQTTIGSSPTVSCVWLY